MRWAQNRILVACCLLSAVLCSPPASALSAPVLAPLSTGETPLVRIGLMRFTGATTLTLQAAPGVTLLGPDGRERAAGTGPWTLFATGRGVSAADVRGQSLGVAPTGASWRLQGDDAQTEIRIAAPGGRTRRYRGSLEITGVAGRLRVINEVTLETYLRGVVASEMGGRAPLEALKAQAVAARTYALHYLGRWPTEGYDLRDNTDSQSYNGIDGEMPESDAAISATSGLILTVAGQPIAAQFSADCGGVTAPGANPDDPVSSVLDTEAHENRTNARPSGWTLLYTPARLTALINRLAPPHHPDLLEAVDVVEKDVSGRARRVRFTWRAPAPLVKKKTIPESEPRNGGDDPPEGFEKQDVYGPPTDLPTDAPLPKPDGQDTGSKDEGKTPEPTLPRTPRREAWSPPVVYEIAGNTLRTLLGPDTLRSTLFTVHRAANGDFVIEGRGWGHGRGLCQVGAMALASPPLSYDFRTILLHYYAGATLSHVRFPEAEEAPESREVSDGR